MRLLALERELRNSVETYGVSMRSVFGRSGTDLGQWTVCMSVLDEASGARSLNEQPEARTERILIRI